ncbi:polysaccharide pyruvyl transferase family protein [Dyadobacter pollutisoli]|uniref:Polysaccharide pyruvyl transferase family protein n=1 Tax=Dyadobacter pollutisoli TaxID=2910158 RepID=A0A9E8NFA2_9BACT|nr:polysaccharide pyruvyl transferase family protein [Dyadobacter pollutisoli]WAC13227.1 polysaccharide pyruvyl transferase family protein [Dyadobacter pollutisoli]
MEYVYYKTKNGNFGDDLNGWLWPKLFLTENTDENDSYFLGIGSILNKNIGLIRNLDSEKKKIVFGSGVRPSIDYDELKIDSKWDIRYLRGPLSSYHLGNQYKYITDAAYAIRHIPNFDEFLNLPKKYEVSLMPYFQSESYFDWKALCHKLGYNYISSHCTDDGVEYTLREIAASKLLITEAMHGAILADIFRVPWHRFSFSAGHHEGKHVSDFKWNDWLYSIQKFATPVSHVPFYKKTFLNSTIKKLSGDILSVEFYRKSKSKEAILKTLSSIDQFTLSKEDVLNNIDSSLHYEITDLRESLI